MMNEKSLDSHMFWVVWFASVNLSDKFTGFFMQIEVLIWFIMIMNQLGGIAAVYNHYLIV